MTSPKQMTIRDLSPDLVERLKALARLRGTSINATVLGILERVLGVDACIAERYGRLFAALRQAGTPIPVNVIWIAAAAIERDAHLVTFDRDFLRIEELRQSVLR